MSCFPGFGLIKSLEFALQLLFQMAVLPQPQYALISKWHTLQQLLLLEIAYWRSSRVPHQHFSVLPCQPSRVQVVLGVVVHFIWVWEVQRVI